MNHDHFFIFFLHPKTTVFFPHLHYSKINEHHLPKTKKDLQTKAFSRVFLRSLWHPTDFQQRRSRIYDSVRLLTRPVLAGDCHTSSINSSDSCSIPCSCSSLAPHGHPPPQVEMTRSWNNDVGEKTRRGRTLTFKGHQSFWHQKTKTVENSHLNKNHPRHFLVEGIPGDMPTSLGQHVQAMFKVGFPDTKITNFTIYIMIGLLVWSLPRLPKSLQ